MRIICIVSSFLFLGFASLLQAQTVYTCGDNYRPIDLTFDAEGTLYSSSKEKNPIFNLDEPTWSEEIEVSGAVHQHDATECKVITDDWWHTYGLTTTSEGHICATHVAKKGYSNQTLLRESLLSCWNGTVWTVQVRDYIFIPRDLLALESGFWTVGEGIHLMKTLTVT